MASAARLYARLSARLPKRARQIVQSLWASVALQALLFGSGILVARSLGPSGRGILAIVLILPAVAAQVASVGVHSAATYYIVRHRPVWRTIVLRLRLVAAVQSAIAVAGTLVLSLLFLHGKGHGSGVAAIVAAALPPLLIAQFYCLAILQGLGDFVWWNIYRIGSQAVYTLGLFGALAFGLTTVTCTIVFLGSQVITTAAMYAHLARHYRRNEPADDTTETAVAPERSELVRFGVVGFLAQVSPVETFRLDSLVVAALFPSAIVGYYAVALSVSNAPRFIADGIVAVAYPHVSAQEDRREGMAAARRYLLLSTLMCGGIVAIIVIVVPFMIPLIFGEEFRPAVAVSRVLVLGAGVISIRRVGSDCLRAIGLPGVATLIEVATLVLLALLLAFLARTGDGRGVALALLLSAAAGLLMMGLLLSNSARLPAFIRRAAGH